MLSMQDLMRHTDYTEEQRVERIFKNARPEYMWYIKRKDFTDLASLLEMAEDLEDIPSIPSIARDHHRQIEHVEPRKDQERAFNPANACRRCGQEGHFATGCRNPPKLFCWECGRQGIRTIECCRKRSGNERRARMEVGNVGSMTVTPTTEPQPFISRTHV